MGARSDRRGGGTPYGRRVADLAEERPDGLAIAEVGADGARSLSWRELDRRSVAVASSWLRDGLGPGACVALLLSNRLEHLVACVAAWKLGAVPVALRWDLPEWERRRVLDVLRPGLAVEEDSEALGRIQEAPDSLTDLPADAVSAHRFGVSTSGSTGTPKVVLHAQPGLYEASQAVTSAVVEAYGPIRRPQVLLVVNALYHSSSITTAALNLVAGNTTVLLRRFSPELLQATVEEWGVTGFMAPTPHLLRLARWDGLDANRLASIEWVQHGGAPLPVWLGRFWIDLLGPERFFTSYGSAESIGIIACRGDEWLGRPGTLGRGVLGTEVLVLDEDQHPVEPGQIGTIFMRRPGGPAGRYAGHGVPALEIRDDGFATVGDLGHMDPDGYVHLADRREDLIVSGGANVYPAEVEAAIGEHPEVADVVVIGLPDSEWGRRVHALVQPASGAKLSEDEIRDFARARLARYKVPKSVEVVSEIPRSEAMKVNRQQLIDERAARAG